ncbi:hypothetical protein IscW_ISCW000646 [Ixodes scapularis]|uniref:Lipocalin/cytosolic fatty-acid binding domain-containing protein n=1 Tax=Ixodes scapularis TaxID=6945 RepID=B7P1P2_IXOSC|nr:hypothetical protein IscW_ISCW000646 [Ixodes scapularis]|eukprot:XP_002433450.1 hypothetical protein IscW_ISCW000646 [Ixodes scapularis]
MSPKVLTLLLATLLANVEGQKLIPMKDFKPDGIGGLWYLIQRTKPLYNDTVACITSTVNHKDGEVYEVILNYKSLDNERLENRLVVKDDTDHPAQFLFTDKGDSSCYAILSRTPVPDPIDLDIAIRVLERNEVKLPLLRVDQSNC